MQLIQELGWAQAIDLLKTASDVLCLAQRLAQRCYAPPGQKICFDPTEKAHVLWLGLSRGHALLKQAVEWDQPFIGPQQQPHQLDGVRGSLWPYLMAFSGWERAARSVIWDRKQQTWQNSLVCLYDHSTTLAPPRRIASRCQPI